MTERWLPVVGWEGLYEVSDHGRVRSLPRQGTGGKVIGGWTDRKGYLCVSLWRANRSTFRRVHVLVLTAFRGPRPPDLQARHLDDVKMNLSLSNLVWGTASENTYDKVRNGRHPIARKTHCKWGHEFTPKNTRIDKTGKRCCRRCAVRHSTESRRRSRIG